MDDLGKDLSRFVVHDDDPQTFESLRTELGTSLVTPPDAMFVRNVLPAPSPEDLGLDDRSAWPVAVVGVRQPAVLTLGELQAIGHEEVTTVLQCSGNGRAFFEHGPSGVPWGPGAVANARWAGVRVADVAAALGGVIDEAGYLTATGGERLPTGADPRDAVERSIPLDKALRDCLLAWELDGEPLPRAHGAPLRLIVPGYYGVNHIKYVRRLAFAARETDAHIQAVDYRRRPVGEEPGPGQPTMWEMSVRSMATRPVADELVQPGSLVIEGIAFGGEQPVDRVEVSVDGGVSWADAEISGERAGPTSWRLWRHVVEVAEGRLEVASRAHDRAGRIQPEDRPDDAEGYGNGSWRDHLVVIEVRS